MNTKAVGSGAVLMAVIVSFALAIPAFARMFDPGTVESLSGDVLKVEKVPEGRGRSVGIHLVVKTEKEELPVHLGPKWYLDKQPVKIEVGDRVTVTGSRIAYRGKTVVIAEEVKKGDAVLKLRDGSGTPAWSRRSRRDSASPQ